MDIGPGGAALGVLVGLKAEARVVRAAFPQARIAVSGATAAGAQRSADRLVASGAQALLSFGLAAGLDPALRPGAIVVPDCVGFADGSTLAVDFALQKVFGAGGGGLLHSEHVVQTAMQKATLFAQSGCGSLDMESGYLARVAQRSGRPFAVLRVICDPAERTLPDAAMLALDPQGGIQVGAMLVRLLRAPGDIGGMIRLGKEAARARAAISMYMERRFQ